MSELIHLSYSPWSEKARWALDHHQIVHRRTEYVPMLGTPYLWFRLRRVRGRFTVPLFIHGETILRDSMEIARHAERHGHHERLFPDGRDTELAEWNRRSEAMMEAGRALVTRRVANDRDAKLEMLPVIPGRLRPALELVADLGISYLIRKYTLLAQSADLHEQTIRDGLDQLRSALRARSYLLGEFSFADIAMAAALQFVSPVADHFIRLGPANRRVWTNPALASEYAELFRWRDHLYGQHR